MGVHLLDRWGFPPLLDKCVCVVYRQMGGHLGDRVEVESGRGVTLLGWWEREGHLEGPLYVLPDESGSL